MVAISIMGGVLGLLFLVSALANWDWYKGIVEFAAAEGFLGEDVTRWLCGLLGLALIGLGIAGYIQSRW